MAAISAAFSASASNFDDVPFIFSGMFTFLSCMVSIVLTILFIVMAVKVVNISNKVDQLASPVPAPPADKAPKLSYLVGLGEKEKAQKLAERLTFDYLYNTYFGYFNNKCKVMDEYLTDKLPKYERIGIVLPERMRSGAAFIDYMNGLTGGKISY